MTIDRNLMRSLHAEIDSALGSVRERFALSSLKLGAGSFDPHAGSFTFKIEGIAQGGKSVDATRYEQERRYYTGWPELGATVELAGDRFTVTGMGKGGAIYATKGGKTYRLKRAGFERKFGGFQGLATG